MAPIRCHFSGPGHQAWTSQPMSRRHHGRSHYDANRTAADGRRVAGVSPSPLGGPITDIPRGTAAPVPRPQSQVEAAPRPHGPGPLQPTTQPAAQPASDWVDPGPEPVVSGSAIVPAGGYVNVGGHGNDASPLNGTSPVVGAAKVNGSARVTAFEPPRAGAHGVPTPVVLPDRNGQCTAPQLRRFIKSRPYVPMHELRRRFGIDGEDDDVTPVRLDPGWIYVGLPSREGSLLGELLRAGEIGYELSLDPRTPIVIGVYPMRPIPRG
jgi:hypothetical protein